MFTEAFATTYTGGLHISIATQTCLYHVNLTAKYYFEINQDPTVQRIQSGHELSDGSDLEEPVATGLLGRVRHLRHGELLCTDTNRKKTEGIHGTSRRTRRIIDSRNQVWECHKTPQRPSHKHKTQTQP